MRILVAFLLLTFLTSCSPHTDNTSQDIEPTLQAAEDANIKEFTEESFR